MLHVHVVASDAHIAARGSAHRSGIGEVRYTLRDRAAAVLVRLPLQAALKLLGRWPGVLVLNYHRIGDSEGQPWDRTLWSAGAEELDGQLETLARCAEVIDPRQLITAMSGRRGRRVLITFDDGYRDNYELAFPLLRRYDLPATFFLATGFLDGRLASWWDEIAWMVRRTGSGVQHTPAVPAGTGLLPAGVSLATSNHDGVIAELVSRYKALPDGDGERFLDELAHATGSGRCGASDARDLWMTWEMAREMHAAGMSIGGHTVTHPVLARLSVEHQREEIAGCAHRLSEELGVEMRWFAYPVGGRGTFTPLTQQILRECGVELAFSFYGGFVRPSRWDPLDVSRIHVGRGSHRQLLSAALAQPRILAR